MPTTRRRPPRNRDQCRCLGRVEQGACCVVGAAITVVVFLGFYTVVMELLQSLGYLSTTFYVLSVVGVWVVTWLALSSLWAFRRDRPTGPEA